MKLNLDFPYALDIAVGIYAHMWKQIPLEPKSTLYAISNASMGAVIVAAAIKLFFSKDAYTNLLIFLLKHSVPLYAGIIILAALPGIIALWERRPLPGAAKTCYITANIRYNEVGALIAILMTGCVLCNVKNLRMLPLFYTEQIASIFVPLCLWIALFYQYEEQRKNLPDHSPSLAWKNQICNILHLANVYFWGLFSALLLICYILYCHIHHVTLVLTLNYLICFTMALAFFHFICGFSEHDYLYVLFLAAVPAILIFCIQWLSWFTVNRQTQTYRILFCVGHLVLYLLIISIREKSLWNLAATVFAAICVWLCCLFEMPACLKGIYLPVFTAALLLLYGLIYLCLRGGCGYFIVCRLLLSAVPTALICAAIWMAGLANDKGTLRCQSAFITVCSTVYMLIVFLREKFNGREEAHDLLKLLGHAIRTTAGEVRRWIGKPILEISAAISEKIPSLLVSRGKFFVVVLVIMAIGYPIFCTLPFSLERVPYKTAENHITALCENDVRAEELLSEMKNSEWYDDSPILDEPDVDQTQYLTFLYSKLKKELVDKSAIPEDALNITYYQITNWYNKY